MLKAKMLGKTYWLNLQHALSVQNECPLEQKLY